MTGNLQMSPHSRPRPALSSSRGAMKPLGSPEIGRQGDPAVAKPREQPVAEGTTRIAQMSCHPADQSQSLETSRTLWQTRPFGQVQGATGPIERLMSTLIRKLSWSRLADPKIAISVSGIGLLLEMFVGATAPNTATSLVRLPLSRILPSLAQHGFIAMAMLYAGDVLACLGLAGMLWAHSQGWTPSPRRLLLVSAIIVAVMACITPVGSSDTGSYAAYGRIAAQGGNPYTTSPLAWHDTAYSNDVGAIWRSRPSVYGPIATVIQAFAALIGGPNVATTIWVLMILNAATFIGIGYLLLKTSDDAVRATLFWTANPVLIQQLVGGGHIDTLVAGAAICAIQVTRRVSGIWGDVLIGVLIGLACGVKINAALIGLGLAWALLLRRQWVRTARIAAVVVATVALEYSYYGLDAVKPLVGGLKQVTLPSPWRVVQVFGHALGVPGGIVTTAIGFAWPIATLVVAWCIYQRISSDQPREVVAPFALSFAWALTAPWVLAWYTALAWVTLTQVPRNRMTRWLAIVTVILALWLSNGGHGGQGLLGEVLGRFK
jgi:hypothetical protein